MENDTIGAKLQALRKQSGLSLGNIARAGGFKGPSSIQRYFGDDYNPEYLPSKLAQRLKDALVGFGDPPINALDIEALTEYGFMLQRATKALSPTAFRRADRPYIECVPAWPMEERDGISILAMGKDPARFFAAPEHLRHRHIGAFFMDGVSMAPRIMPGEVVFFERECPAAIGSEVVVSLAPLDHDGELEDFIVGKLVGQTANDIEIQLFNPEHRLSVSRSQIDSLSPVLKASELLEQVSQATAWGK